MSKITKKLNLKKETVKSLSNEEMLQAGGASMNLQYVAFGVGGPIIGPHSIPSYVVAGAQYANG